MNKKKLLLYLPSAVLLLASCHRSYTCTCYSAGKRDTSVSFGWVKSDEANRRCDVIRAAKPADSCDVTAIVIK